MEQHLRARPELLPAILTTLFEMVLFEDVGNQWSLSRPMLALILVNEDIYLHLQRQIIDAQPADKCGPCPSLRQSRRRTCTRGKVECVRACCCVCMHVCAPSSALARG